MLTNCTVRGNSATGYGGGIANQGTLNVASSTGIIDNRAKSAGGGISTTGGSATVTDSNISGNRVNSSGTAVGGGIDCENSLLSLTTCTASVPTRPTAVPGPVVSPVAMASAAVSLLRITRPRPSPTLPSWATWPVAVHGTQGANGGDGIGGGIAVAIGSIMGTPDTSS